MVTPDFELPSPTRYRASNFNFAPFLAVPNPSEWVEGIIPDMSAITYACLIMTLPDLTLPPVLELWEATSRCARLNTRKPCAQKDEVLGALAKPSAATAY